MSQQEAILDGSNQGYSTRQTLDQPNWVKKLGVIDLFSFLPTPKASDVSTKRSVIGSIALLVIFLSYVITSFVLFVTNNPPRINATNVPLNDQVYQVPKFAVTYLWGDDLNQTFYNKSYFTFALQQVTAYKDTSIDKKYVNVALTECEEQYTKDWLGPLNYTYFCPSQDLEMQGTLYSSEVHQYARIVVYKCVGHSYCEDSAKIDQKLEGGRIFLYIRKDKVFNYATGNSYEASFELLNYYMLGGIYQRQEIIIQKTQNIVKPDYLQRFSDRIYDAQAISQQRYYQSKVPNPSNLYLIWFRLDNNMIQKEYYYNTIVVQISQWGALWGVLFALFAFYLIKYNEKVFYEHKPSWQNFDEEIQHIKKETKKIKRNTRLDNDNNQQLIMQDDESEK